MPVIFRCLVCAKTEPARQVFANREEGIAVIPVPPGWAVSKGRDKHDQPIIMVVCGEECADRYDQMHKMPEATQ